MIVTTLTLGALLATPMAFAAKHANHSHHKTTVSSTAVINVNKATAAQIASLKGIGPKKAARIVAYRTQHGQFATFDDLDKVKGISANSVKKLEKQNPGRMKLR